MGRPLSRQQLFGANTNNNIKVQFHNGTASVKGYIVEQTGSKRFKCKDADGNTAVCYLVDKASADLAVGEMSISFKYDDGTVQQAVKITRHRISVIYNGILQSFPWNFSTSTTDGYWQVEEAGTDSAMSGYTDLEGDDVVIPAGMDRNEPLAGSGGSNSTVPGTFSAANTYISAYNATGITFRDITASGLTSVTNSTNGLIRKKYVGNFATTYIWQTVPPFTLDMSFFGTPSHGPISEANKEVDTYLSFGLRTDLGAENGYAFEWKGYIQAPVTGNMQFFATIDDDAVMWIGDDALNPTNNNYLWAQSGNSHRDGTDGVTVVAGKWYPIRLWFQEVGGAEKFQLGANNSVNSTLYGLGAGATAFTVAHNSTTRGY
jgi:hypothetical protein